MNTHPEKHSILPTQFTSLNWLTRYNLSFLSADLLAGITLAAFTLPEAMAYAGLAGLGPQAGLYAGILGSLAYFISGTSRQLTVGPTSALSILLASGLASLAVHDPGRYAALAAMTAILVAALCLVAWVLRLGFIVHFVSEPVLTGFSAGASLYIGMTQLNKLFGIHGAHGEFFERLFYFCAHWGETDFLSLMLGMAAVACLYAGHKYLPRLPISLFVVGASILVMTYTDMGRQGVKVVGAIPQGFPAFSLPSLSLDWVRNLVPLALAVFLLSYIEGSSMARTFSKKHGYEINPDQELLALGTANLASGIFQGYPVGGSLSRSAVNDRSGAKTQLAAAISSILLAFILLFFTRLFTNLPETVLAAVVIVAVKGLFNVGELKRLYHIHRIEFWNAMVALWGVLFFGLLKGVLIGAVVSIVIIVRHVVFARVVPLGKIRGTDHFMDLSRYPEAEKVPGVALYGLSTRIFFANCQSIKKQILAYLAEQSPRPTLVVANISATVEIDLMAAEMLTDLYKELREKKIDFRVALASWPVRDLLKKMGCEAVYGGIDQPLSVTDLLTNATADPGPTV
jgi:sulfate permease, SulP family